MELGKHYRISRSRSATSILLAICVSLATGVAVVLCAIPLLDPTTAHRSVWLLLALPPLLAVLYPPLLWRVFRLVPRLGPPSPSGPPSSPRRRSRRGRLPAGLGLLRPSRLGAHGQARARVPTPRALGVSIGGYAFAWVAGLLFFVLPAGAGARDLSLVVALSAVLPPHQGLALAVLSRGVSIVCDLGTAGLSALHVNRLRERWTLAQEADPLEPLDSLEP